ncbi:hypothetical protein [Streptomyces rapamycinicus]|uniref:hypothetical protein n=1 Tax=Streptomyces rapamycinicus TaxID=1226757 RepID=UPI0032D94592
MSAPQDPAAAGARPGRTRGDRRPRQDPGRRPMSAAARADRPAARPRAPAPALPSSCDWAARAPGCG